MASPSKQKVTLNLPYDVVRAYRLAAIRQGVPDQTIIVEAVREYLGLNALTRLQNAFAHLNLSEEDADQLAVEAVNETRVENRRNKRSQ
jgi:hypothetical protein